MAPAKPEGTSEQEGPDAANVATITAAVLGATLAVGALALYDTRTGLSVAAGAVIAVANLATMSAIIRALVRSPDEPELASTADGTDAVDAADPAADPARTEAEAPPQPDHADEGKRGGAAWGGFALVKIIVLFGGIWVLLTKGIVDPIPLVVGYGVLPLGIAASSLLTSLMPRSRPGSRPASRKK